MAPAPGDDDVLQAIQDTLETHPAQAVAKAEEAVSAAKDQKSRGYALNALAWALVSQAEPQPARALEKADEALVIFKELKDTDAQMYVYRTIISTKIADKKNQEARSAARDVVALFHQANNINAEASAQLLLSEACLNTGKTADAVSAALDAVALSKQVGDMQGQADALLAAVSADLTSDQAILAATERASLFKEMGQPSQEASALVTLAEAHIARIGEKLATCDIPSVEDTMAAMSRAKDGYALHQESGQIDGMEAAIRVMQRVLLLNGVPADTVATVSNPESIYQDVMNGMYSTNKNAFPARQLPKQAKLEDVVPSSKQLERSKFSWHNSTNGYSYTLVWQTAKDRDVRGKKPRGSYDITALNTGAKTQSLAHGFSAMSNECADRSAPLVVFMTPSDASTAYGSTIMSTQNTLAAMISANVKNISFVQFGETHVDWTDTRARQLHFHPVTLAMIRSARIEAPQLNIGYIAGDAASWIADPAPLIESLFDTLEQDENELVYKRGEAYAPLLVHRPQDDLVTYVKPRKKMSPLAG